MKANVIANVYETYDYDSFKRMEGNRKLTLSRLNKLVASFRGGRILCPITVNDKMEIVDGQGRYDTCKALGLPVHFVVDPDATIDDCRRMNRYNTSWTKADFLHSYAEMGNVNYIIFEQAYEKTKLTVNGLLRIAHKLTEKRDTIEKGVLVFTKDDAEKAFKIDAFIKDFKENMLLSSVTGILESALIIAYETDGFDQERLLKNAKVNRASFVVMPKVADMLKELSRIYNYRNSKRVLYFEDYLRQNGADHRDYNASQNRGFLNTGKREPDVSTLKKQRGKS